MRERFAGSVMRRLGRTHRTRWERTAHRVPGWDERNELIASMVPPSSSVLDVGAGFQSLRSYLDPTCTYQPADLIQKTPETWLIDFNADIYPEVSESFDVVICSGVLEYAKRPEELLAWMGSSGTTILVSYAALTPDYPKRKRGTWFNHMTREELERMFEHVGLGYVLLHTWTRLECPQLIYQLKH